jgi:hypothetical protein
MRSSGIYGFGGTQNDIGALEGFGSLNGFFMIE